MSKRVLRSILVTAFSVVVAFGALAGPSGAKSGVHKAGSDRAVVAIDDASVYPQDTRWD